MLEKFNPNTKIRFKMYNTLRLQLLPYVEFLRAGQEKQESNGDGPKLENINASVLEYANTMKIHAHTCVLNIKEQLIKDFYSLTTEEWDSITVEEFDLMFQKIAEARQSEIDFLFFQVLSSSV